MLHGAVSVSNMSSAPVPTFEDIYRSLYKTDAIMHVFREAAHYRYMNVWAECNKDLDFTIYQLPIDWRVPEERRFDREAYSCELVGSPCFESASLKNPIQIKYELYTCANAQFMVSPADFVLLAKETSAPKGELFVNANPRSPYYGIVVYVLPNYENQYIVAHNAETFNEFCLESVTTLIENKEIKDTCERMRRGGNKWFLRDGIVADLGTKSDIMRQMRFDNPDLQIYAEDVGCYYSVGVVNGQHIERTGALFCKVTGLCVSQGMGYLPDFPVLTWENSFKQLVQLIIRQQESEKTYITNLHNLRKFGYQDNAILAELDLYCKNNISETGLAHTTKKQRDQRTIVATCDKCGSGMNEISGTWHTCTKCKNYDICTNCAPYWLTHPCEQCHVCEFSLQRCEDGKRLSVPSV